MLNVGTRSGRSPNQTTSSEATLWHTSQTCVFTVGLLIVLESRHENKWVGANFIFSLPFFSIVF